MSGINNSLLANESQIIFVSGFIGKYVLGRYSHDGLPDGMLHQSELENEARKNCWKLYCHIYHVREANQQRKETAPLNVVLNKSKTLAGTSRESVKEVQELLFNTPIDTDGITRIVFAHSHGAKVLFDALEDFKRFLKKEKKSNDSQIKQKEQKIFDHLAIFTLGGMQDIPTQYAKVCFNLYLPDDNNGSAGAGVFGKLHFSDTNVLTVKEDGSVQEKLIDKGFRACVAGTGISLSSVPVPLTVGAGLSALGITSGIGAIALTGGLVAIPVVTSAILAAVAAKKGMDASKKATSEGKHYMEDYLDHSGIMNKILELLEINDV